MSDEATVADVCDQLCTMFGASTNPLKTSASHTDAMQPQHDSLLGRKHLSHVAQLLIQVYNRLTAPRSKWKKRFVLRHISMLCR